MDLKDALLKGNTSLGIELGSTRIKAVLIDSNHSPIASGSHEWENQYVNNIWTYPVNAIWNGLQDCYANLAKNVLEQYGVVLKRVGSIGISAMMHGYMAFNSEEELMVEFRTWRNTITEVAAEELTKEFDYNIPQRWSVAHLYQAILNKEEHVKDITYLTTLAGYIHWKLTGRKVLGIGDASGMFPIHSTCKQYEKTMVDKFNQLVLPYGYPWRLEEILPEVLVAGEEAGALTTDGAVLLDPNGNLEAGIPFCPPEGDAGTGMVATNSIEVRTGNVSAGTSIFAMIVLEKELKKVYPEIDLVTTPIGNMVAMVHCNNCTSDLNAWVKLFEEFAESFGIKVDKSKLFSTLYQKALEGDADCGGLLSYNYVSGESITGFEEGRPLFVRSAENQFNLANFMRVHLFTAIGALKKGLNLLIKEEGVQVDKVLGHGGLFKTEMVGQKIMAAAMNTPVTVNEKAGEGGAWGIAVLAAYMLNKEADETLAQFLNQKVFVDQDSSTVTPDPKDVVGFEEFMKRYDAGLVIERAAVNSLK